MHGNNALYRKESYILVKGAAPILLVAHLDTVHQFPVKDICKTDDNNILMSPQGIGGDDRCGVYALNFIHSSIETEKRPWLLFCCDEEIGAVGAQAFTSDYKSKRIPGELSSLKLILEIDRKGKDEAVFYDCDNPEFEKYVTEKGFNVDVGSFSDISYIAPVLGVAAANLSSGYYNAHTLHEYINLAHLHRTIEKVMQIVEESTTKDFLRFDYVERMHPEWRDDLGWGNFGFGLEKRKNKVEVKLPDKYKDMYDALLDYYDPQELSYYIDVFGNEAVIELYDEIWA